MSGKVMLFNAGIVTMDPARHQYNSGAVLIEGDRISRVGKSTDLLEESDESIERIDLRGRWILPGLINTHVHTSQQLGRGLGDDVPLLT
jgi:5-methylthioadenosine/S-adenosylhomocysteine deaminase